MRASSFSTRSTTDGKGSSPRTRSSVYHTGKRTRDWRKLKIVQEQEFVVGGWTDSRTAGRPFGALLLGYYEDGGLKYAGHTGSGFNQRELERVIRLLKPLEIAAPPFTTRPRTNERPHWTKPSLVAQLKFTEWTDDGLLRHPIYLGMRDDVKPETVRRETEESESRKSPKSRKSREESGESKSPESRRECRSVEVGRSLQSVHSSSSTRSSAGRARGRCGCPVDRRWRSAICARCSGRS